MSTPTPILHPADTRWRKEAVNQLSYALNLGFTLAIAALGYCFILLRDKDFFPGALAKTFMTASLAFLGLSGCSDFAA